MHLPHDDLEAEVDDAIEGLLGWLTRAKWRGFDPYDGLTMGPLNPRGKKTRQLVIQTYKRAPFDLRRPFGAEPYEIGKAIALGLSAACVLGNGPLREYLRDRLLSARNHDYLWGYEFDVQTRWAFYSAGTPNAIATSFALHALLDDQPPGFAQLVSDSLESVQSVFAAGEGHHRYFRYVPRSDTLIHNANLLMAAVFARSGRLLDRVDWLESAAVASKTSLGAQASDGSWPYGDAPGLHWVDGFHTAYTLIALKWLGMQDCAKALPPGLTFYFKNLFTSEGRPKIRVDRVWPLEVHTAASALWCLGSFADDPRARELLMECTMYALKLRKAEGSFKTSSFNPQPYIRWGQAHMLLGLAVARKALFTPA